jgi:peroxiredoxin
MQKYGLHYPVLLDPGDNFVAPYGVNGVPETFIIDRHGHVVAADPEQMTQKWLNSALDGALGLRA